MITAQDIREKTFERARLNGYSVDDVDSFLEEVAENISNSLKENAVLKSKMKVLVDKIEEYRGNEEAINSAVLSAQKLAVQIEAEAKEKAAAILADAQAKADARLGGLDKEVVELEGRLEKAKAANAEYCASQVEALKKQIKKIQDISEGIITKQEQPAPAVPAPAEPVAMADIDASVRAIDEKVSKIEPAPEFKMNLDFSRADDDFGKDPFNSTQPFSL